MTDRLKLKSRLREVTSAVAFLRVHARSLVAPLFLALLAGCCPHPPPPPVAYHGKTDTMDAVVADINANNSKIPTLYAHHVYQANVVDE